MQQQGLQLAELVVGEGRGAADRPGVEATGESGLAQPALHADAVDAEGASDGGRGLTFAHGRDGTLAKEFMRSSSSWSSHNLFYTLVA